MEEFMEAAVNLKPKARPALGIGASKSHGRTTTPSQSTYIVEY